MILVFIKFINLETNKYDLILNKKYLIIEDFWYNWLKENLMENKLIQLYSTKIVHTYPYNL